MTAPQTVAPPEVPRRRSVSPAKRLLFSFVPLLLLLVGAELVLRVTGAGDRCYSPMYKNSGLWDCDPILRFRMRHDLVIEGQPLNSLAFRNREFTAKKEGTYRVLALGDSCTLGFGTPSRDQGFFVATPYPQRLEQLTVERHVPRPVEVLNAGVCGYNTYHGIMLLRSKLRNLHPDLITVRYGWNDLLASGEGSEDAFRETDGALNRGVEDLLLRTKLYGFTNRLAIAVHGAGKPVTLAQRTVASEWAPSVPLERYKAHLRRLAELAAAEGAQIWFLTSVHAFMTNEYQGHEPEYSQSAAAQLSTIRLGGIASFSQLAAIHARYNEATRTVGAELGVPVVDMEPVYRSHAQEHLFSTTDVIHPLQRGHELEAETLYARLVTTGAIAAAPPQR